MKTIIILFKILFVFTIFLFNCSQTSEYFNQGYMYQMEKQHEKAIEEYKEAIQINPKDADAYNNIGAVLIELERYEEASEYLRKALQVDPRHPEAHFNLGLAYQMVRNFNEAQMEYKRAMQYGYKEYQLFFNLGTVFNQIGKIYEAETWYNETIKSKSNFADAYYNLAVVYSKLEQKRESINNYKNYLKYAPNAEDRIAVENLIISLTRSMTHPIIEIYEPPNITESGDVIEVEKNEITVSGTATDNQGITKLIIDEKYIPLKAKESKKVKFSEKTSLKLGENEIKVVASNVIGNSSEFSIIINSIEQDIEPPEIVILEPVSRGIEIVERSELKENIRVTGLACDKSGISRVTINNIGKIFGAILSSASDEEKLRFNYPDNTVRFQSIIPSQIGSNEIIINVTDIRGNTGSDTLRIIRRVREFE